jgi:hypothetical protein
LHKVAGRNVGLFLEPLADHIRHRREAQDTSLEVANYLKATEIDPKEAESLSMRSGADFLQLFGQPSGF